MPESESLRAEAARRGISLYRVRAERSRGKGFRGYTEEREARQRVQAIRSRSRITSGFEYEHLVAVPLPGGPKGLQGPYSPSPDTDPFTGVPDWDYYWPTRTINPPRPRTIQARYSQNNLSLEVIFRDGTPWHYDDVPPEVWTQFKRTESPGRFINSTLNGYPYGRGGWGSFVGE